MHKLRVITSHDVYAVCSCGKWSFTTMGKLTAPVRERMEWEHKQHQQFYSTRNLGLSDKPEHKGTVRT